MLGKVTRQKSWRPDAPSTRAASSSSVPWACIRGMSSRATNGKVTKIVARMRPGTANRILSPWASTKGRGCPDARRAR